MKFSDWDELIQAFPSNPSVASFNIRGLFSAYRNGTGTMWTRQSEVFPADELCHIVEHNSWLQLSDVRDVAQLYWDSDERILQRFPFVEEEEDENVE